MADNYKAIVIALGLSVICLYMWRKIIVRRRKYVVEMFMRLRARFKPIFLCPSSDVNHDLSNTYIIKWIHVIFTTL